MPRSSSESLNTSNSSTESNSTSDITSTDSTESSSTCSSTESSSYSTSSTSHSTSCSSTENSSSYSSSISHSSDSSLSSKEEDSDNSKPITEANNIKNEEIDRESACRSSSSFIEQKNEESEIYSGMDYVLSFIHRPAQNKEALRRESSFSIQEDNLEMYYCSKCGKSVDINHLVVFKDCTHQFCSNCVEIQLNSQIKALNANKICCLNKTCKGSTNSEALTDKVNPTILQNFDAFFILAAANPQFKTRAKFCTQCDKICIKSPEAKTNHPSIINCVCGWSFCSECSLPWKGHKGKSCKTFKKKYTKSFEKENQTKSKQLSGAEMNTYFYPDAQLKKKKANKWRRRVGKVVGFPSRVVDRIRGRS